MKNNWVAHYRQADYEYSHDVDAGRFATGSHPAPRAYCDNPECRNRTKYERNLGVKKNVKKDVDWCPDCGHALFWKA